MKSITKSENYKVGSCGIRAMLNGDKKRAVEFENGDPVKVTDKEYEAIDKLKWCELKKIDEEENGS